MIKITLVTCLFLIMGCNTNSNENIPKVPVIGENAGLPTVQIKGASKPRGDIQVFDMPIHPSPKDLEVVAENTVNLDDNDLVIGLIINERPYAYPVRFLADYEVLNDEIEGQKLLITWCPLVGTGAIYNAKVENKQYKFSFGEGLINDNLLMVDEETHSVWSQLTGTSFVGDLGGKQLDLIASEQTTWLIWKSNNPETQLVKVPNWEGRKYFYRENKPGTKSEEVHQNKHIVTELGFGIVGENSTLFLSLNELQKRKSPIQIEFEEKQLTIFFDAYSIKTVGENGKLIKGYTCYQRAWELFYPKSKYYKK